MTPPVRRSARRWRTPAWKTEPEEDEQAETLAMDLVRALDGLLAAR